jgi:AcrR family transcriptional regulator
MDYTKDDEVRKAIFEAAKRVFQKWGLNKTTMEDIAREAGKGKSTLYYYYKSKEEIFETVVTTELSDILSKVKSLIANIESPKEKLKKYLAFTLIEIKKTVSIYPLVKGEMKGNKEHIDRIIAQIDSREEKAVMEILKQGKEIGEFNFLKEEELEKAANVIIGLVRGMELYLFLENDDMEKIDIAVRMLTDGI